MKRIFTSIVLAASLNSANSATMYAASSGIFTVDSETGITAKLGTSPSLNVVESLAFDVNGGLYAGTGGGGIFSVDTTTGISTNIGSSVNDATALAFGLDGFLYAGTGGGGIFRVDPATGITSSLGSGVNLANDLIFTSAIPIPPTVWLFGSGLLGLISLARKKA